MASASKEQEATKRFGELAVENGFATESEVEVALEAQKQTEPSDVREAARLGQILLDMGTLTPEQVEAVLLAQARLRRTQTESVLDTETDTKIYVPKAYSRAAQSMAAEPSGWLILESEGRTSSAYPLWEKALLGRAATHEVPVPDMLSSRDHASVEFKDGRHTLSDLASRNGTFVNEEKVESAVVLKPGDQIRIGTTTLRYAPSVKATAAKSAPPPEPPAPEPEPEAAPAAPESPPAEDATDVSSPAVTETTPEEEATDLSSHAVTEDVPPAGPGETHDDSSTSIKPITDTKPPEEPEEEKKPEPAAEAAPKNAQLEEARKVAKIAGGGLLAGLRTFDGLVSRIPPKIHNQRKYVVAGSALGILAVFMPWIHEATVTHLGLFTGTGWLTLTFFVATMAIVLIKANEKPVEFRLLMAVVPLPLLAGIFALLAPVDSEYQQTGFGMILTMLVGVLTAALAFFTRGDVQPEPEDAPLVSSPAAEPEAAEPGQKGLKGLAGGFLEKTKRLARDVSGQRAKEKAKAAERRDALLGEVADAAANAKVDAPETGAVIKAGEDVKAVAAKGGSGTAKATVQHKQKLKAAEGKLQRARIKLARGVIERGLAVEGTQEKIEEIKALDARVKDLS